MIWETIRWSSWIWIFCGIIGYLLGTINDLIFHPKQEIVSPLFILLGPIILFTALKSIGLSIIHFKLWRKDNGKR